MPLHPALAVSTATLDSLLEANLQPLAAQTVLIVGDLALDHYLWGRVERTTPEAPVPVVRHERDSWSLGAAANVAANVRALGGQVRLVGVIGHDEAGARLKRQLSEMDIPSRGIVALPDRPTTIKSRVVSMGQQILRIDREVVTPVVPAVASRLARLVTRLARGCHAILLSEYDKGVLVPEVIAAAVAAARRARVPLLVDPKGHDYSRYAGADLLTPNLRETALAVGFPVRDDNDLRRAGRALIRRCGLHALVVTMDAEGLAVIRSRGRILRIPSRAPEVSDVTGAGDTSIATLALGLAAGLSLDDAAVMANCAGGIEVSKLGVATVSPAELKAALQGGPAQSKIRTLEELRVLLANQQTKGRKVVFTNGCFDLLHTGHIRFLHEARKLGDLLVVGLNTDRSVRALKGPGRPILPQEERAAILAALEAVNYVVFFDGRTPEPLLEELRPDVLAKGRNVPEDQVVGRDIVQRYGGRVCRLPVLHKSAASDLIDSLTIGADGKR